LHEIAELRRNGRSKTGRPPLQPPVKAARAIRRTLVAVTPLLESIERESLSPQALAELGEVYEEIRRTRATIECLIKARLRGPDKLLPHARAEPAAE
jgi:hypothetical protein